MPDPKPLTGMPDDALLTPNEMMAEAGRRARRRAEAVADDKADIEATVNTGPVQAVTVQAASIAGKGVAARPRAARRLAANEPPIADHIDYEAEDNTLAACMQMPAALATIAEMMSNCELSTTDFHRPARGRLLDVMVDLHATGTRALDPQVVRKAVEKDAGLVSDLGGRDAVKDLLHHLNSLDVIATNIRTYAETVHEEAAQRHYLRALQGAQKIATEDGKTAAAKVADTMALFAAVPAVATGPDAYALAPLDWQTLLRDGVPAVEYISEPYLPKGARIASAGRTGTVKSLWCSVRPRSSLGRVCASLTSIEDEPDSDDACARLDMGYGPTRLLPLRDALAADLRPAGYGRRGDASALMRLVDGLQSERRDEHREVQQFDATVRSRPSPGGRRRRPRLPPHGPRASAARPGGASTTAADAGATAALGQGRRRRRRLGLKKTHGVCRFVIVYGKAGSRSGTSPCRSRCATGGSPRLPRAHRQTQPARAPGRAPRGSTRTARSRPQDARQGRRRQVSHSRSAVAAGTALMAPSRGLIKWFPNPRDRRHVETTGPRTASPATPRSGAPPMWAWIPSKLVAEMTEPIPAAAGEGLGMGCPFSRSPREASLPSPP